LRCCGEEPARQARRPGSPNFLYFDYFLGKITFGLYKNLMLFLDSLLGAIAYDAEVPQRHRLWRRDTCYADTIGRRGADVAPSSAPQILAPSSVVTTWLGYMSRESRTGTGGATRWIGCARVRSVQQPGASAEQAENSKWRAASGLEQSGCNR
jgi:hypothetical protein